MTRWKLARAMSFALVLGAAFVSTDEARADDLAPRAMSGTSGENNGLSESVGANGAMTYGLSFDLPAGRGDAQPSLGLTYVSGARVGEAGWGWSLDLPTIERAPLSGWPKYLDNNTAAGEDRYTFNGAPLTFVCMIGSCPADEAAGLDPPSALFSVTGARYYRRQVEGGFERFYLSSDRTRWTVQRRGGEILEFGAPATRPDLQPTPAVDVDVATGRIFRWNLAVQRDLRGTNNVVIYQWQAETGRKVLRNIYYVPPASGTTSAPASAFAYHVELVWEAPTYRQEDRTSADRRPFYKRLRRVAISAKTWANAANRELVRAYNLTYFPTRGVPGLATEAPFWGRSVLKSVAHEGRCSIPIQESGGFLPAATGCPTLSVTPTTFGYQRAEVAMGTATRIDVPGITYLANTTIFDVNRDGLPDIVESWPANPSPNSPTHYTECSGQYFIDATAPHTGDPVLICSSDDAFERTARQHRAWINTASAGVTTFPHACLDAGDVASTGSILWNHTNLAPGVPSGSGGSATRAPSLFSLFGSETLGDWGDGSLLWSMADHAGFGIKPAGPVQLNPEDPIPPDGYDMGTFTKFCPEGAGSPATYPAYRWTRTGVSLDLPNALFAKDRYGYQDSQVLKHRGTIDIDGDGYPDLLRDSSTNESNGFRRVSVAFTRRYAANEGTAPNLAVKGPALVPFAWEGPIFSITRAVDSQGPQYFTYADINGDGIEDIITSTTANNAADVRLGDGRGGFGCNISDASCVIVGNGTWLEKAYRISITDATTPWPLQQDGPWGFGGGTGRVHLFQDVTGDGLADLIAYTPRSSATGQNSTGRIQLWINTDGRTFKCANNAAACVVGTVNGADQPGPLASPLHRIAIVDLDGNGTQDFLLVGYHAAWTFSFLTPSTGVGAAGPSPGLLTTIDNGVGATTEITYKTLLQLDREASELTSSFHAPWTTHAPVASAIVTHTATRDTTTAAGGSMPAPFGIHRARTFEYRDPAYDPWDRKFRGFARTRSIEDYTHETIQTWYFFGDCEHGPKIAIGCVSGSDGGYDGAALLHPNKALSGLPVRTDRFVLGVPGQTDDQWLSTTTTTYGLEPEWIIPQAKSDRAVTWAKVLRTDTYLYDPSSPVVPVDVIGVPTSGQDAPSPTGDFRHLKSEVEYDAAGNVKTLLQFGQVTANDVSLDDKIETQFGPTTGRCTGSWACRATSVELSDYPHFSGQIQPKRRLQKTTFGLNGSDDVTSVSGELFTIKSPLGLGGAPAALARNTTYGVGAPTSAVTAPNTYSLSTFTRDAFGNVQQARGPSSGSQSCTSITFDGAFKHFPERVIKYAGTACAGGALSTYHTFDRGVGAPTSTLSPNESLETFELDGFGRVKKIYAPVANGTAGATEASVEITHGTQAPLSWVRVRSQVGPDHFLESVDLMNGLGEHVVGFDQADSVVDGAPWVLRDWTERDSKGMVVASYRPWFFQNVPADPVTIANTAAALTPQGNRLRVDRDDFGRTIRRWDAALQTAQITHAPLRITMEDAEQINSGSFVGRSSSGSYDGHGRLRGSRAPGNDGEDINTDIDYLGTGKPTRIRRWADSSGAAFSPRDNERTAVWDSFGRMIENHEPNTGGDGNGWRYVYDLEGRLVGTSDARGCGKNVHYDALSRPIAEDFSPCLAPPAQPAYTTPNVFTGDGTEVFYRYDTYESGQMQSTSTFTERASLAQGQLTSVQDRGAHTRLSYDDRGRVRRMARRIAKPGVPASALASRFDARWFKQESTFDVGDRLTKRTTGLDEPDILVGGESAETRTYSARGLPRTIGSSYGTLLSQLKFDASGRPTYQKYGDAAGTILERGYDSRGRNHQFRVHRPSAPAVWSMSTASYPTPNGDTTQLELMNLELTFDRVHNPLTITEVASSVWPDGARPVSRSLTYDPAYRVKQVDYVHTGGVDPFVSGYRPEALAGDRSPVAEREGAERIQQQRFWYDAHGNVDYSDDNEVLTFDRSFGEQHSGWTAAAPLPAGTGGPNQFLEGTSPSAPTTAAYDLAGNMTELTVSRATCSGIMPACTHRFRYEWDEVGQLTRARRWDFPAGEVPAYDPGATPAWKLEYAHGFGGRSLTTKTDDQGVTRHTLDIFDTMRAANVVHNGTAYGIRDKEEIGFIGGVGRIFIDREGFVPQAGPTPIHVYFAVGDQLGSAAFVIDKDSGEVVERTAQQAFGKVESDYRPDRWGNNREDFKFTGKEEDIEVGATYFGARFYSPHIGRWMSADPLTIHGFGADPNPYAYVGGRVSSYVDPFGLAQGPATPTTGDDGTIYMPDDPLPPVERPRPTRSPHDCIPHAEETRDKIGDGNYARSPNNLHDVIDTVRDFGQRRIPIGPKGNYVTGSGVAATTTNHLERRFLDVLDPTGVHHVLKALKVVDVAEEIAISGSGDDKDKSEEVTETALLLGSMVVGAAKGLRLGPSGRITSKNWRARNINNPACRQGCEAAAKQIQKQLGGANSGAVIVRITPGGGAPGLGGYRGQNWGWGHHEVVVKGGRVYDAFTGGAGASISEYKAFWEHAGSINFGF